MRSLQSTGSKFGVFPRLCLRLASHQPASHDANHWDLPCPGESEDCFGSSDLSPAAGLAKPDSPERKDMARPRIIPIGIEMAAHTQKAREKRKVTSSVEVGRVNGRERNQLPLLPLAWTLIHCSAPKGQNARASNLQRGSQYSHCYIGFGAPRSIYATTCRSGATAPVFHSGVIAGNLPTARREWRGDEIGQSSSNQCHIEAGIRRQANCKTVLGQSPDTGNGWPADPGPAERAQLFFLKPFFEPVFSQKTW